MDPWWWLEHKLPAWRVDWAWGAPPGLCVWADRRIVLRLDLSPRLERCVLHHELIHAERGPFPRWLESREEEAVRREAARRLIPIRRLGEALAWTLDLHELADELGVDHPTLQARMRGLHPAERAYLRRRLQHHE